MAKWGDWNQNPCLDTIVIPIPNVWAPNYDLLRIWHEAQISKGTRIQCFQWTHVNSRVEPCSSWGSQGVSLQRCVTAALHHTVTMVVQGGSAGQAGTGSLLLGAHLQKHAALPACVAVVTCFRIPSARCGWRQEKDPAICGILEQNVDLKVFVAVNLQQESMKQNWEGGFLSLCMKIYMPRNTEEDGLLTFCELHYQWKCLSKYFSLVAF